MNRLQPALFPELRGIRFRGHIRKKGRRPEERSPFLNSSKLPEGIGVIPARTTAPFRQGEIFPQTLPQGRPGHLPAALASRTTRGLPLLQIPLLKEIFPDVLR